MGSGKSTLADFMTKAAACLSLNPETLDPCRDRSCYPCKNYAEISGHSLLFAAFTDSPCQVVYLDGTRLTTGQLEEFVRNHRGQPLPILVHIEEFQRIADRAVEDRLLTTIEQTSFTWIASTMRPDDLSDAIRRRFIMVSTSPPSPEEMVDWLTNRCIEAGITWDHDSTLVELAKRTLARPSDAIQILGIAEGTQDCKLLLEHVEDFEKVIPRQ